MSVNSIKVREAKSSEFTKIGKLMIDVYSKLEGFPSPEEQPKYYEMLQNIGNFTDKPKVKLLVAINEEETIVGAVLYFGDMKYYGSGGSATQEHNAAGFRLLAVKSAIRGEGIGKLLTLSCIEIAKSEKQYQIVIHSTKSMQIAWKMYEKMGFMRSLDLDFMQSELPVFGFRLIL